MQPESIDCACVIHSNGYDWSYVENLYNMLQRNFSYPVNLHVFTEPLRSVPDHMIKHELFDWPGVSGPRQSWWYKLQMFDSQHFSGQMLYFDLDVVITGNLDWILGLNPRFLWTIKDFKNLFQPLWTGMNSSVMYWNTAKYHWVWNSFNSRGLEENMQKYRGDQDFLSAVLNDSNRQFMPSNKFKSWRWQVHDGGLNWKTRVSHQPGAGPVFDEDTSGIIFHGTPKPHEIDNATIAAYWCGDK